MAEGRRGRSKFASWSSAERENAKPGDAADAEAAPAPRNPVLGANYAAPVMSQEELSMYEVPFAQVPERLRDTMDKYGIAVVTGVVSEEEVRQMEDNFKEDLMDLVDHEALEAAPASVKAAYQRFAKEGPAAFPLATASCFTQSAGFCLDRCLPHGRLAWRVRRHPRVHEVYRALYQRKGPPASRREQLVTSIDATFFTPGGQPPATLNTISAHSDQNQYDVRPGLSECDSFQGVLYVWPADSKSSTTAVWPGSHRQVWPGLMADEKFVETGAKGFHYSDLSAMSDHEEATRLSRGWMKNSRRAVVPAGGLFLWNSRTLHCGWKGGPRLAQTVCLQPAVDRSEQERVAKLRLLALGLPGCHWATAGMQHDMTIGAAGVFAHDGLKAAEGRAHDNVVLPLKPALWPTPLHNEADLDSLVSLVNVTFHHTGMWEPVAGCRELLEQCVRDDFKLFV